MKRLVFIMCLFLAGSALAGTWSTAVQDIKLTKDLKLGLIEQIRVGEDNVNTYVQYIGLKKEINDNLEVAGWYKYVGVHKNHQTYSKNRYVLDAIIKGSVFGLRASNRFRLERGMTDNFWNYRNKIKFSKSFLISDRKITPFISDEVFTGIRPSRGFIENRLTFGVSTPLTKNSTIALGWLIRDKKKSSGWNRDDIIMLGLKVSF